MWGSLLAGLVQLIGAVARYMGDRQMLAAGEATAISEGQRETLARIELARKSTAAMDAGPGRDAWAERVRKRFDTDQ